MSRAYQCDQCGLFLPGRPAHRYKVVIPILLSQVPAEVEGTMTLVIRPDGDYCFSCINAYKGPRLERDET